MKQGEKGTDHVGLVRSLDSTLSGNGQLLES